MHWYGSIIDVFVKPHNTDLQIGRGTSGKVFKYANQSTKHFIAAKCIRIPKGVKTYDDIKYTYREVVNSANMNHVSRVTRWAQNMGSNNLTSLISYESSGAFIIRTKGSLSTCHTMNWAVEGVC